MCVSGAIMRLAAGLAQVCPGRTPRRANAAKEADRLCGRHLFIGAMVREPKEDGKANLNKRRDVAGHVNVLAEPEGTDWGGLDVHRWLAGKRSGDAGSVRVIPSAEPVMLEDHSLPRSRKTLRWGKGQLVVVQLHAVIILNMRLELREVRLSWRLHPWILVKVLITLTTPRFIKVGWVPVDAMHVGRRVIPGHGRRVVPGHG